MYSRGCLIARSLRLNSRTQAGGGAHVLENVNQERVSRLRILGVQQIGKTTSLQVLAQLHSSGATWMMSAKGKEPTTRCRVSEVRPASPLPVPTSPMASCGDFTGNSYLLNP